MNVHGVASALAEQGTRKDMKEFILERSLMNVNSVVSVVNEQEI